MKNRAAGRRFGTLVGRVRLWAMLALLLLAGGLATTAGCGEPTDNPEDCRPGEFFDEGNEQCVACPAVSAPQCEPGCGFRVIDDDRNCPTTECTDQCLCDSGAFFSEENLECESCEEASDPPALCFED